MFHNSLTWLGAIHLPATKGVSNHPLMYEVHAKVRD